MSDKLHEIRKHGPNEKLVKYIRERLLPDFESGKLQAIAGVVVHNDGSTSDICFSAPKQYPLHIHSDRMIGCLERLKFDLIARRYGLDAADSWYDSE